MLRRMFLLSLSVALCCSTAALAAAPKPKEIIDPEEAKADPDFAIQGEYVGQVDGTKVGAQVIARGNGEFDVVGYKGGLPGDGWQRGDEQHAGKGKLEGKVVKLSGGDFKAEIAGGKMTVTLDDGSKFTLDRVERKSPTLGAKPPAGAIVLFDGTGAEKFDNPSHFNAKLKTLDSGVTTKDKFGDYTMHMEFRLSYMPEARGQGRSNSGVYIHNCYEMQVLDSFGLKGENNECGGFYHEEGARRERLPAAAGVADLRHRVHRAEVRRRQEGGQRADQREAKRHRDPQGLRAPRRHPRRPERRPRPAGDPFAGARQPRAVSEYLVGGEEIASGLVRRKRQLARLVSDVSVSTMK